MVVAAAASILVVDDDDDGDDNDVGIDKEVDSIENIASNCSAQSLLLF